MKKTVFFVLVLLCLISITSCGLSEGKKKADEKLKKYKPAFEQAVKDAYGEDAKLTHVKCDVDAYTDGVFRTTYYAKGLEGTLKLGGNSYKVYYDDVKNSISDNVHSAAIIEEIKNMLPFDASKFIDVKTSIQYLDPSIDLLDKYLESGNERIDIFITTTEDLAGYKTMDVESISTFKKVKDSNDSLNIKVVCLNDKTRSDALMLNIKALDFSLGEHPKATDAAGTAKDAFEVYKIKNAIEIDYPDGNMLGNVLSYME